MPILDNSCSVKAITDDDFLGEVDGSHEGYYRQMPPEKQGCPGRGRDTGCPIPPAQIPTSGITA